MKHLAYQAFLVEILIWRSSPETHIVTSVLGTLIFREAGESPASACSVLPPQNPQGLPPAHSVPHILTMVTALLWVP